jgi:hypothetical protein
MNPVLVDPRELDLQNPLPDGILPTRASVSLNFLFVTDRIADTPGLFVFNYEPKTYNSWYPPFHFSAWTPNIHPARFADLKQVLDARPPETRLTTHLPVAIAALRDEFNLSTLNVSPDAARRELWLKFSKSQQVWTLYEFVYLWATTVPMSALDVGHPEAMAGWLPLAGFEFKQTISSGRWKGLPLVDNLANLLRESAFVEMLRDHSS